MHTPHTRVCGSTLTASGSEPCCVFVCIRVAANRAFVFRAAWRSGLHELQHGDIREVIVK